MRSASATSPTMTASAGATAKPPNLRPRAARASARRVPEQDRPSPTGEGGETAPGARCCRRSARRPAQGDEYHPYACPGRRVLRFRTSHGWFLEGFMVYSELGSA